MVAAYVDKQMKPGWVRDACERFELDGFEHLSALLGAAPASGYKWNGGGALSERFRVRLSYLEKGFASGHAVRDIRYIEWDSAPPVVVVKAGSEAGRWLSAHVGTSGVGVDPTGDVGRFEWMLG